MSLQEAIPIEGGDAGALARLPRFIQFEDALARLREIFRAPEKMRFGRLAIAPSTSTFLVIGLNGFGRSEEHTSELQSLMRISYAVFCLKKKKQIQNQPHTYTIIQFNQPN